MTQHFGEVPNLLATGEWRFGMYHIQMLRNLRNPRNSR